MKPTPAIQEQATVIGIETRTSNDDEADPLRARIPALWKRIHEGGVLEKVPAQGAPPSPVAVYTDYEGDHSQAYRLVVGAVADAAAATPPGFARATIPAGRYLRFGARGEMPQVVIDTWKAVWAYFAANPGETRAYTTDFETYPDAHTVEIHIAVK